MNDSDTTGAPKLQKECIILWSTQSGRAKACARRCARTIRSHFDTNKKDKSNPVLIIGKENLLREKNDDQSNDLNNIPVLKECNHPLSWSLMNSGCAFDDFGAENLLSIGRKASKRKNPLTLIMFVSTTGDAEQCDSIQECWNAL